MGEVGAWRLHEILGGVFYACEPSISSGLCASAVSQTVRGQADTARGERDEYDMALLCDMQWRGEPVNTVEVTCQARQGGYWDYY